MSDRKTSLSIVVYATVSLLVLYLGYALNLWRAADHRLYTDSRYGFMEDPQVLGPKGLPDGLLTFDRSSESLVIGRLVASRAQGLLWSGGFTGWFTPVPSPPEGVEAELFRHAYQYKLYLDGASENLPPTYGAYKSQIGGQAFLLGVLDGVLGLRNTAKLRVYYHIMAFLTAACFVLMLLWFYREFGSFTAWFLTIGFALLCYPTLYARSLWWVIWAFYIPFVLMLGFHRKEESGEARLPSRGLFLLMFSGMLIKVFFNGCEYITTTIVMALMPQCYYAIKHRWALRRFLNRSGVSLGACVLAVCVFFLILSLQSVLAGETFAEGLDYVTGRFLLRTHGDRAALTAELGTRDPTPMLALLKWYFTVPVVFDLRGVGLNYVIGMKSLLVFYLAVTGGWALAYRRLSSAARAQKAKSLLITLWISMLAPCSWFVIFKGHSDVHRVLVGIVWYMPFMFYGMALVGMSLEALVRRGRLGGGVPRA